jgi:tRNA(Ile)-lysidine synthetase-like protein
MADELLGLHPAVRARVYKKMAGMAISGEICAKLSELLQKRNFSYSIGSGLTFVCELGVCSVHSDTEKTAEYKYYVNEGKNEISEYSLDFLLTRTAPDNSFSNVYKISIQADLSSAIIDGGLYLRPRRDGDTIRYGNMTRKIKTLYSDAKIPRSKRALLPLLCDNVGVVWAPGFGVREDRDKKNSKEPLYACIGVLKKGEDPRVRMYLTCEFKDKVLK